MLRNTLNSYILKICILEEDFKYVNFKTKPLNDFLYNNLLIDPSFFYKGKNKVQIFLDNLVSEDVEFKKTDWFDLIWLII